MLLRLLLELLLLELPLLLLLELLLLLLILLRDCRRLLSLLQVLTLPRMRACGWRRGRGGRSGAARSSRDRGTSRNRHGRVLVVRGIAAEAHRA